MMSEPTKIIFEPQALPGEKADRQVMFDSMSAVDLADALERTLDSMTEETYDGELISEFLDALDRKAPLAEKPDRQAAFAEFRQKIHSFSDDGQAQISSAPSAVKRPKLIRLVSTIAATVAILFALLIGAQASGIDVFGSLAQWTNAVFHLGQGSDTNSETFNKISRALEENGFPDGLVPTWYPEGFQAGEMQTIENSSGKVVMVEFTDREGRYYSIWFDHYNLPEVVEQQTYEINDEDVEEYPVGGKMFYILSNMDGRIATWSDTVNVETIQGDLSTDELKRMLDSIK